MQDAYRKAIENGIIKAFEGASFDFDPRGVLGPGPARVEVPNLGSRPMDPAKRARNRAARNRRRKAARR